jgi:hypothetical protein
MTFSRLHLQAEHTKLPNKPNPASGHFTPAIAFRCTQVPFAAGLQVAGPILLEIQQRQQEIIKYPSRDIEQPIGM